MKFSYQVKHDGVLYPAGTEAPVGDTTKKVVETQKVVDTPKEVEVKAEKKPAPKSRKK